MGEQGRLSRLVMPPKHTDFDEAPVGERGWRFTLVAMHTGFAVIIGLAVADVGLAHLPAGGTRPVALAALGALVLAYLTLGGPALQAGGDVRAVAYLVVLAVVIGVVAETVPDVLFIFFIAYPQVWTLVERPLPGVFWTLVLLVTSSVGTVLNFLHSGHSLVSAIGNQALGVAFSLLYGLWAHQLIGHSQRLSVLVGELEAKDAQLARSRHAQGVLAERERVAREVHDTLAQGYTSIVMLAQTASSQLASAPGAAADRLALIEEVARDNLSEARALIAELAPPDLDGRTLLAALDRLVDRFRRETDLAVSLHVDADTYALRRDEEVVLVRAAQEALSNARRHAEAHSVTLRLETAGEGVRLLIEDDGNGFDGGAGLGRGLSGLCRRVEEAGGRFELRTAPGAGTSVAATITTAP